MCLTPAGQSRSCALCLGNSFARGACSVTTTSKTDRLVPCTAPHCPALHAACSMIPSPFHGWMDKKTHPLSARRPLRPSLVCPAAPKGRLLNPAVIASTAVRIIRTHVSLWTSVRTAEGLPCKRAHLLHLEAGGEDRERADRLKRPRVCMCVEMCVSWTDCRLCNWRWSCLLETRAKKKPLVKPSRKQHHHQPRYHPPRGTNRTPGPARPFSRCNT